MSALPSIHTTRQREKELQQLSPFELKNTLIELASKETKRMDTVMLNAGRGNPNWIATTPREAFFLLGQFGLQECKRMADIKGGMAGSPVQKGISDRFRKFLKKEKKTEAATLLKGLYDYGIKRHAFDPDAWMYELTDGIIGDHYPVPVRMLEHTEVIVHDYLIQEMCDRRPPEGKYRLFAVEGGTAAMCYIFDSLMQNFLASRGDTIALMVPIFTPYIEISALDRYDFHAIHIEASEVNSEGRHTWQYPEHELDKLKDPKVKILYMVNPSNPPSRAVDSSHMTRIIDIIHRHNPHLMVVTDDVYGTFVPGFRSLMAEVPDNTIGVYSFSKYFGCTGWRLGVIALHENNIFDRMLHALGEDKKQSLAARYGSLTLDPTSMTFIDRMVADSRQVALNHTAGLSLPQQMQMLLFAASALLDKKNTYKKLTQKLIQSRLKLLWDELEITQVKDPMNAGYYSEIDLKLWADKVYGSDFTKWLTTEFEPVDILFRLAEETGVVLLNGGGFDGPEWSIRVSLANLYSASYTTIGKHITAIMQQYAEAWKAAQ